MQWHTLVRRNIILAHTPGSIMLTCTSSFQVAAKPTRHESAVLLRKRWSRFIIRKDPDAARQSFFKQGQKLCHISLIKLESQYLQHQQKSGITRKGDQRVNCLKSTVHPRVRELQVLTIDTRVASFNTIERKEIKRCGWVRHPSLPLDTEGKDEQFEHKSLTKQFTGDDAPANLPSLQVTNI